MNRTQTAPCLSLVVPVYNEEACLVASIQRLVGFLEGTGLDWEFILVDDGSTDGSASILRRFAGGRIRVIGYRPNRGRGYALRCGLQASRGEVVLTTEADSSWDLDCLGRLIDMVRGGADLALASPYREGGGVAGVPFWRLWLSRSANALSSRLLGVSMSTGMTRAYRRAILPQVLSVCEGKEFHLDVLCRARKAGLRLEETPARLSWDRRRGRQQRTSLFRLGASLVRHGLVLSRYLLER